MFQCNGMTNILIENEIRDVLFIKLDYEWIKIKVVILTVLRSQIGALRCIVWEIKANFTLKYQPWLAKYFYR